MTDINLTSREIEDLRDSLTQIRILQGITNIQEAATTLLGKAIHFLLTQPQGLSVSALKVVEDESLLSTHATCSPTKLSAGRLAL
jgi:hypothetical protein